MSFRFGARIAGIMFGFRKSGGVTSTVRYGMGKRRENVILARGSLMFIAGKDYARKAVCNSRSRTPGNSTRIHADNM